MPGGITAATRPRDVRLTSRTSGNSSCMLTHRTWTRENDDDKIWISKSSFAEPREGVHVRHTMRQDAQEQTRHYK